MDLTPMITVTRGRFASTTGQVLEHVRTTGVAHRDELAARTGLSVATVGRAVAQLVALGVLRECPEKVRARGIGRPGIPVEIDRGRYVTIGLHIGRTIATVALGDLTGGVLAHETVRRAPDADVGLEQLAETARRLLAGHPGRVPVAAGLVGPWRELALDQERLGARFQALTGLDVRTGDHIAAVAATEFFHRRAGTGGVTLYVYARETVGFAVAVDKGVLTEVSRVGSLTHFPTGSDAECWCGRRGCLEVTGGDRALVRAAVEGGLLSEAEPSIDDLYAAVGRPEVLSLLRRRARILGQVAAATRDIIAPDRVVLVGQAFTGCPAVLDDVTAAFRDATALGDVPVSFTRFGAGIQAITACTIALGPVYDDPAGSIPDQRAHTGPSELTIGR